MKPLQHKPKAHKTSELKGIEAAFQPVLDLITASRRQAVAAVNTTLIDLYWHVGEYISRKIEVDGWGRGTVVELSLWLQARLHGMTGFSPQNLWRMRQFFATYHAEAKLSPLVRELNWTQNLMILGKCKSVEEREFYLRLCRKESWDKRTLERQINGALFERTVISPAKLSTRLRELHPSAAEVFKDAYLVEFLNLPENHSEADLHRGLLEYLRRFLIELGRDFCFIGSEYPIQVGNRDFVLDLLFFNRTLNCLVAFELKVGEFQPEHLGKLEFYLEALDRDIRKSHENPSIGVLLCANRDSEVVEYALSRSLSPALIAEYQTKLPDKALLQQKLHEFYQLALPAQKPTKAKTPKKPRGKKA